MALTPPDSNPKGSSITTNPNAADGNPTEKAQGETYAGLLKPGKLYVGVLVGGDNLSNTYTVKVGDRSVEGAHWVGGFCSGLLGINTNIIPTRGTRVMLLYGNPSFVIQGLPSDSPDHVSGFQREMTQSTDEVGRGNLDTPEISDMGGAATHQTVPKDMFEGEFEMTNQIGIALRFLHTMMGIEAGDLAKVECFLVNDMVRIVSDCFKHISAFGDMQIYNDGRLNVRFDGTSYEHEAWSALSEKDEKASVEQFQIEGEADLTKTGRWRMSQYIGWVGDFIHTFVTEPSKTASSIGAGAFRPGKSRIQQMSDGSILMQGVGDIAIERVCRVQVPIEKKRWDDPSGVNTEAFKQLEQNYLKIWEYGDSNQNIHHCAYQLREYARWLSCYHSYARFHQLAEEGDEWEIPLEDNVDCTPSWTNQEKDVEAKNPNTTYMDAYACIRIMRDGSIINWDGYGNAISMGKSGVQISSVEHIELDAAGDVRITAGQDIFLKARRNIEISAIVGGLILKASTWWKALVEHGVMWLKSDAEDPAVTASVVNPRGATADYPDVEQQEYAMILETSRGRTAIRSHRTLLASVEGQADASSDHSDITASIVLESKTQDVRGYAHRNLLMKSGGAEEGVMGLESVRGIVADSPKFFSSAYLFDIRQNAAQDTSAITIRGGKLNASWVAAKIIGAETRLAGPERTGHGADPPQDHPYIPHKNHCDVSDTFDAPVFAEAGDLTIRTDYVDDNARNDLAYEDLYPNIADAPKWSYPAPADYKWPNETAVERPRFEPLAQQRIGFDSDYTARTEAWGWNSVDRLKSAPRTDIQNLPYPGNATQELYHPVAAGSNLHEPLSGAYSDQDDQTALRQRQLSRRFRKRDVT